MTIIGLPLPACEHINARVAAEFHRVSHDDGEPITFAIRISVTCMDCDAQFRFTGVPQVDPERDAVLTIPVCSLDELVLLAPIEPS